MNVNEKLKELIKNSGRKRSGVAVSMGFPSVQVLDRRLLSTSVPKIDFVAALLDELGYKLVIVHKDDLKNLKCSKTVIDSDFHYEPKPNMSRVAEK